VSFAKFLGVIVAMLLAALVLVWIFVTLAAVVHALTLGDGRAAGISALLAVVGLAVAALGWWAGSRVVKARTGRR